MRLGSAVRQASRRVTLGALTAGEHTRSVTYIDHAGAAQTVLYVLVIPVGYVPTTKYPGTLGVAGDGKFGTGGEQMTEGFGLWLANNLGSITEIGICPEMPTAPNLITRGDCAMAYMACLQDALTVANIDAKKIGAVGVSGGGRDLWTTFLKWSGAFAYLASIEGPLYASNVDWALGTTSGSTLIGCQNAAAVVGPSALNRGIWQGQNGDDGVITPDYGRTVAAGFGDTLFTAPFTTPPTYSGSPAAYQFDASNFRYRELQTGGHSWDPTLNSAAFLTWRQAQSQP